VHLHDTYFVVAHFHYVMMGSALIAMIGGLHHWWPKMTGKMYDEKLAIAACIIIFIGFNLTFFTQFMLGSQGMPRRYYDYQPEFQVYHVISTIGSYIMGIGFFTTAVCLVQSLRSGAPAPANPWGGRSLEWQCASPPPHDNFKTPPRVGDPYDFSMLQWNPAEKGYDVDPVREAAAFAAEARGEQARGHA
jgi:cytochrome c oxidase subunit 1